MVREQQVLAGRIEHGSSVYEIDTFTLRLLFNWCLAEDMICSRIFIDSLSPSRSFPSQGWLDCFWSPT